MEELLTTRQVQKLLKVDRITIYRMLKDGRVKGLKVGNQWRFHRSEIDKLFQSGESKKTDSTPFEIMPIHCIGVIQDVFADIIDVGSVTTDVEGQPITEISNSCDFCNLIIGSKEGEKGCISSWKRLAESPKGDPKFFRCHAGFQYARGRIEYDGKLTSILIAGQFLVSKSNFDIFINSVDGLAENYGIDKTLLKEAALKVRVLDVDKQDQIGSWLKKISDTFEILTAERASLMERLISISEISKI